MFTKGFYFFILSFLIFIFSDIPGDSQLQFASSHKPVKLKIQIKNHPTLQNVTETVLTVTLNA